MAYGGYLTQLVSLPCITISVSKLQQLDLLRVITADVLEPAASILIGPRFVKNSTSWNELLSTKSPRPSWPSLFPPAAYRLPHAADTNRFLSHPHLWNKYVCCKSLYKGCFYMCHILCHKLKKKLSWSIHWQRHFVHLLHLIPSIDGPISCDWTRK